jgi:integrase
VTNSNPFRGVKVSKTDPRIRKQSAPIRVWSWDQMHALADAVAGSVVPDASQVPDSLAGSTRARMERSAANRALVGGPMIRVLSDCGLRVSEMLPLRRGDLDLAALTLEVRRSVSDNKVVEGTKTDHLTMDAGRVVPVPPGLAAMLREMLAQGPTPINRDAAWLFPTTSGGVWWYENWRRDVLVPARDAIGLDIRAHEMRHSFASLMLAQGVDPADLAKVMGHTALTLMTNYTHSTGTSFETIRAAVG